MKGRLDHEAWCAWDCRKNKADPLHSHLARRNKDFSTFCSSRFSSAGSPAFERSLTF